MTSSRDAAEVVELLLAVHGLEVGEDDRARLVAAYPEARRSVRELGGG